MISELQLSTNIKTTSKANGPYYTGVDPDFCKAGAQSLQPDDCALNL